jgi:predicted nucleic acid-binding protein
LARVEVIRAVRPHGPKAIDRARRVLAALDLLALDDELLDTAAMLDPPIRSLDAIHLAAALRLGGALGDLVTYDTRMAEAARTVGLVTSRPS